LLQAANNELMSSLFSVIETALDTYFRLSARNASNFNVALPQHLKIYEAVKAKQPEVARQAMIKLVSDSQDNIRGGTSKSSSKRK
jgi:DNA-binding FadR family transcriptional regulator